MEQEEICKYKLDKEMRSDEQDCKTKTGKQSFLLIHIHFSPVSLSLSHSLLAPGENVQTLKDFSGVFGD